MDIKINETPVRTSRNFRVNNITINNIDIPNKLDEFKNIEIIAQNITTDCNKDSIWKR